MHIALKIDVDTYHGTLQGVPALVSDLASRGVYASFYFSLGPDHTGRALRRVFRPGFLQKVARTSVISHYGIRTLLYGVLLPGPHIGRRAGSILRAVRDAGHETGIHCYDHVYWQDNVVNQTDTWTRTQVMRAVDAYREAFGTNAQSHCAAGWQVNAHLFALEDALALSYASDTRGTHPFLPVMDGVEGRCPQLPTTLPTLDELVGVEGATADDAIDQILSLCRTRGEQAQVFTLHAELEGQQFRQPFLRLIDTWLQEGRSIGTLQAQRATLNLAQLPKHTVTMGEIPGRSGLLALQGPAL